VFSEITAGITFGDRNRSEGSRKEMLQTEFWTADINGHNTLTQ
jgi:hypothetical protein